MKAPTPLTPSQTVGPFFTIGLSQLQNLEPLESPVSNLIAGEGNKISIAGRVFDGNNEAIPDALIEIWQANASGDFIDPNFFGFARSHTNDDPEGRFLFDTIKPGAASEVEAPYVCATVFMRGLLTQVYTRIYFSDEKEANSIDQILNQVPKTRRKSLIAQRNDSDGKIFYEFNIHMQGDDETVFFSL